MPESVNVGPYATPADLAALQAQLDDQATALAAHEARLTTLDGDVLDLNVALADLDARVTALETPEPPIPPEPPPVGPIWYVATTGNDANAGTEAAPYRTIGKGVSMLPNGAAGNLYIAPGTYVEMVQWWNKGGLNDANRWIIKGHGGVPVIRPAAGTYRCIDLNGTGCQYITFQDLKCDGGAGIGYDGVKLSMAHHIRLVRVEVCNVPSGTGIIATDAGADDNEFLDCHVHHNGGNQYAHGLYLKTKRNLVRGGDIHHNAGSGVHVYNGSGGADDNRVERVVSHENGVLDQWGAGILLTSGTGNVAINCLCWGNDRGFQFSGNAVMRHCTAASNTEVGFVNASGSGATLSRCVAWLNGTQVNLGTGTAQDTNLFANPSFVDAAARNYRLAAGSPALAMAPRLADVLDDLDGTPRPATVDLGCYERA